MTNFLNLDKSQFTNHLDSAQTIFFLRELESIKSRFYETPYAPLKANQLIPIDSTTPRGATTVTYTIYDRTGNAKIISNYADDLPSADTKGQQITSNIRSIGNYFEFSIEDIRAAEFAGKPLEQRKANAALQEQLMLANKLAFFGDAPSGVQGWLTNPNIPSAPVAGANPAAKLWSTKVANPKLILDDLNEITRTVVSATNGVESIDTIVMPIDQYQIIQNTQLGIGTDTTILQFYVRNNPGVTVTWANELKGAFINQTDGMIAYRNSIDKFWQEIPQEFEMFAPQWTNLSYKIPCHSKHGGTIVVYPKSQAIRTGI